MRSRNGGGGQGHGRRQGGAEEGHAPPGFSHTSLKPLDFKNSSIFSS